jgi:hypothetical protein
MASGKRYFSMRFERQCLLNVVIGNLDDVRMDTRSQLTNKQITFAKLRLMKCELLHCGTYVHTLPSVPTSLTVNSRSTVV